MDTVGKAPLLCAMITSFDQSNPDWSLDGQQINVETVVNQR
jgi:hypothetical protein